jgi:hypothetical protein
MNIEISSKVTEIELNWETAKAYCEALNIGSFITIEGIAIFIGLGSLLVLVVTLALMLGSCVND